jgi:hypothetical protein
VSLYAAALFLHVVGALGLVAAMALEWVLVARLGGAETAERARDWLGLLGVIRRVSPASLAALLLAGVYMAVAVWGGAGWIVVAFAALLLLPPLGMIAGLRLPAVQRELEAESGPLSPALRRRLDEPLFVASIQVRTAIVLGIVFLMTNKPDAAGSVVALAAAVVLGVACSLPALERARRLRRADRDAEVVSHA